MKNSYNSEYEFLRALMDKEEVKTPVPVAEPEPEEAPEEELQPVEEAAAESVEEEQPAPVGGATQVDEGWRAQETAGKATQVDEGWRAEESAAGKATQVDEGWRAQAAQELEDLAGKPVAVSMSLEDFKATVGKLTELTASGGSKYTVKKTLSKDGGESAILLCTAPDGKDVVAKVYYEPVNGSGSSAAARARVLEYMKTEDGRKYTLAVSEIGFAEVAGSRCYFEIMPYCKDGDLTHEEAFSFEQIVELTEYLNEALRSMHNAGILHRDIKPANLYRLDGRIVIGDFGVAKLAKAGVTRHTAGTDGYRAPESVLAVAAGESAFFFDEKSDYYSLGVTLGSLFEGHFVYEGMNAAMITVAVRQGRLPLARTDRNRDKLENLLAGLCRYDSRFRFGYDDVCRWLSDHNYTGSIEEDEWPKAFRMMNEEYRDEQSLFEGITKDASHWEEGKELLYSKYFENFFMSFRTDLARAAQKADEAWRKTDRDKGLSMFLKALFAPGPIVWKGYTFRSLNELAEKMVVTKTPAAYGEILQKKCVSHWLANTVGIEVDADTVRLAASIEELSMKEPEIACYWFGNSFANRKTLTVCGSTVHDMTRLLRAMFEKPMDFYTKDGMDKLMDRKKGADLYGYLYSLGCKELVDQAWSRLGKSDEFNKACVLMALLDDIAVKMGEKSDCLREFFVNYGPMGIATYTKRLAEEKNGAYQGLDSEGKQALNHISGFKKPKATTVNELFRGYTPLLEHVQKLQGVLINNPYCVETGVYEKEGVLCTNLKGCFAFRIFGRLAPLGFHAWIESAKGGEGK